MMYLGEQKQEFLEKNIMFQSILILMYVELQRWHVLIQDLPQAVLQVQPIA